MYLWRIGGGAVALLVVVAFALINRGVEGEEYRERMYELISHVKGYEQSPDYYRGLVDSAHDAAFLEHYHLESGRRGRKSWLDEPAYIDDMFTAMIQAATAERAPHIAAALTAYYEAEINPPPEPVKGQKAPSRRR